MKTRSTLLLLVTTIFLMSCANEPTLAPTVSGKGAAISAIQYGEFTGAISVPANTCNIPTDCIWSTFTEVNNTSTKDNVQTSTWSAIGYSYDCSTGNDAGKYSYTNTPATTGRNYAITAKSTVTWSVFHGRSGVPGFSTVIKRVTEYSITLLANGPTMTWKETWNEGDGPLAKVSNVRCR